MSGNRTSIFEAFSMPHSSIPSPPSNPRTISRHSTEETQNVVTVIDDSEYSSVFNDVEEVECFGDDNGTLWMSCSPGRDSDNDVQCMDDDMTYEPSSYMEHQPVERYVPIVMQREPSWRISESTTTSTIDQERHPLRTKLKIKPDYRNNNDDDHHHHHQNDNNNKPLSSYALFFRDTQMAIKDQNPDISFGEISRVVATMWDNLDANHKQYYNKLAEEAKQQEKLSKKDKPSFVSTNIKDKSAMKKQMSSTSKDKRQLMEKSSRYAQSKSSKRCKSASSLRNNKVATPAKCLRENCSNKATDDPRWSKDYCSTQCVVSHCKDVYKAWVALRKSTTEHTNNTRM